MKKLTVLCTLVMMFVALYSAPVRACGLNPVAVIATDPVAPVFYSGEPALLDASGSYANCGNLYQYRWRVRGPGGSWITLYQGSQSTYMHTFELSVGHSEQIYDLELRVRDTNNRSHTQTITVTVTRENKSLYYLTDHLGSVRVTVNERGDVAGWDDYYPFGLQMPGRTQNIGNEHDDVKFTGHELEQQGGLGLYYAQARMYDPAIGRFLSVDPMAASFPSWSSYVYAVNNPLIYIDPDGRAPWLVGAVVGAAVEATSQVVTNMAQGQSFSDAVTNIDAGKVGVATAAGAASGGLSVVKGLATGVKVAGSVAINVGEGAVQNTLSGEEVTLNSIATDVVFGVGGSAAGEMGARMARNSNSGQRLEGVAVRAESRASRAPSQTNSNNANRARSASDNHAGNRGVVAGKTATAAAQGTTAAISFTNTQASPRTTQNQGVAPSDKTRVVVPDLDREK